jgi:hypothetical protein
MAIGAFIVWVAAKLKGLLELAKRFEAASGLPGAIGGMRPARVTTKKKGGVPDKGHAASGGLR